MKKLTGLELTEFASWLSVLARVQGSASLNCAENTYMLPCVLPPRLFFFLYIGQNELPLLENRLEIY